jgi:hypothetical protein
MTVMIGLRDSDPLRDSASLRLSSFYKLQALSDVSIRKGDQ